MSGHEAVGAVVRLMAMSPVHEHWTCHDIERLVVPPLDLGQCILLKEGLLPVAWGSYAFLTPEAEAGYRSGLRRLQADDWNAGDRLWLVDVVAPFGHGPQVTSALRRKMRDEGRAGQLVYFRRNKAGKRRYSEAVI